MPPINRFSLIGLPNYALQNFTEVYNSGGPAGFYPAGMPLSNLGNDEPSAVARILTTDPHYSFFEFVMADGLDNFARDFGGFALVNTNMSRFGKYRVVGRAVALPGASNVPVQRLAPTATAASTNVTGSHTDVDELTSAPDASWITPTNQALPWDVRFTFNTPAAAPRTGADYQAFVLWVRRQGSSTVQYPLVKVELWENGALKLDLGTRIISETAGQYLVFRWDASLLTTASGANVEIKVRVPFNDPVSYAELGTVSWTTEHVYAGFTYDSGWLPSPFSAANDIEMVGPQPTKSVFYIPDTPWTGVIHWYWFISDDQTDQDEGGIFSATTALAPASTITRPDGYTQAGAMFAGYTFVSARGQRLDAPYSLAVVTEEFAGETEGGQTYGADSFRRRQATVDLYLGNRAEAVDLMDRLDWRLGKSSPVFIVIEPAVAADLQLFHAFCGTVSEAGVLSPLPQSYDEEEMVFTKSYTFTEKL